MLGCTLYNVLVSSITSLIRCYLLVVYIYIYIYIYIYYSNQYPLYPLHPFPLPPPYSIFLHLPHTIPTSLSPPYTPIPHHLPHSLPISPIPSLHTSPLSLPLHPSALPRSLYIIPYYRRPPCRMQIYKLPTSTFSTKHREPLPYIRMSGISMPTSSLVRREGWEGRERGEIVYIYILLLLLLLLFGGVLSSHPGT